MTARVRLVFVSVCVALVVAACSGGSEEAVPPPVGLLPEPTATQVVTEPAPTGAPVAVVSDDDLIAAALAALEAAPDAGQDLIAYDVLESTVGTNGNVTIRICGWTGETVFESVYDAMFRTSVEADGTVTADNWQTPFGAGTCVNSELVNSAFATINAYEDYWTEITADPSLFATDPRGEQLLTERQFEVSRKATSGWLEEDVYLLGTTLRGKVPDSAIAEVLWRRSQSGAASGTLEMAFCHPMDQTYGIYRDGALLTASRAEEDPGLHALDSYILKPDATSLVGWRVDRSDGVAWSDCFFAGEWVDGANVWREEDTDLVVLESPDL